MNEKFLRELYPDILAVAAGVAAVFAFAPFDFWWLLPLAYGALFFILYLSTPARAFVRSLLFGAAHFALGLHWLFKVVEHTSAPSEHNIYSIAVILIISVIIFYISLFPAFAGLLSSLIPQNRKNSVLWWLLVLPSVFTLSEWSRDWMFSGFPWFQAGYAAPLDIASGLPPLSGVLGASFCLYLTSGCLGYLCLNYKKTKAGLVAFGVIASLLTISLLLKTVRWTRPLTDKAFNVQLIQGDADLDQKFSRPAVIERVRRYQALVGLEPRPLLSVWPESSVSLNYNPIQRYVREGFKELADQGTEVLFGSYRKQGKKNVNGVIRASDQKTVYAKKHLLPFAEYTPGWIQAFKRWLPEVRMNDLTPGEQTTGLIQFKGVNIALSICFELIFGEELAERAGQADLNLHLSDLGWFKNTWAVEYLLRNAQIRALESGKPMIYSVNLGNSAFIDHNGKVLRHTSAGGNSFIYQRIVPYRGVTPHSRRGCLPLIIFCFLAAFFGFFRLRRIFPVFDSSKTISRRLSSTT